jgi:hypothetical protein
MIYYSNSRITVMMNCAKNPMKQAGVQKNACSTSIVMAAIIYLNYA